MRIKSLSPLAAVIFALVGLAVSSDANAGMTIKKIVNCDKGMDVQRFLDRNLFSLPMELRLVGDHCSGFEITQDDVSISALYDDVCPGATVVGGIEITGGRRIELSCIAVTGGDGVTIFDGQVALSDVEIYGVDGLGLFTENDVNVYVVDSLIHDNEEGASVERGSTGTFVNTHITDNAGNGLYAVGSSLTFLDGSVTHNDGPGILVESSSSLNLERSLVANNIEAGVLVRSNSDATLDGVNITDNSGENGAAAGHGILAESGASVMARNSAITGNGMSGVELVLHSIADLSDGTMVSANTIGAVIRQDSALRISTSDVAFSDGIECVDAESSFSNDGGVVIGLGVVCTDFNE